MSSSTIAAYLEFVRNLTPQIAFGTCFMLLRLSIDTDKLQLDWDGIKNALALWSCGLLFFGALVANMARLMQSTSTSYEPLEIEILRLRSRSLAQTQFESTSKTTRPKLTACPFHACR